MAGKQKHMLPRLKEAFCDLNNSLSQVFEPKGGFRHHRNAGLKFEAVCQVIVAQDRLVQSNENVH